MVEYSRVKQCKVEPWLSALLREETVPAVRKVNSRFCLCTSLVLRPMFGLGTRLRVHTRTTLENVVLRNGQQPQSVVSAARSSGVR